MPPRRTLRKARHTERRINRLKKASRNRNVAETLVPISPPTSCISPKCDCRNTAAKATPMDISVTTDECPSEKKKPTEIG
ncbi:hypothetical protein D3C71_1770860 [compost metagenome]